MGTSECGHEISMATPSVGEAGATGRLAHRSRPVIVAREACLAVKQGKVTCQLCWVYCPDACIAQGVGPVIDLTYCKGCGICAEVCPADAIEMVPEGEHGACGSRPRAREDRHPCRERAPQRLRHDRQRGRRHRRQARARAGHRRLPDHAAVAGRRAALGKWVESGELPAEFVTVESEHSALTVCIAASTVGARVFTATSANGLAYMTEQVWWAAGARLPIVMCIANRAHGRAVERAQRPAGLDVRARRRLDPALLPRQPGDPRHHRCRRTASPSSSTCRSWSATTASCSRTPSCRSRCPAEAAVDAFLPPRPTPLHDRRPGRPAQHRPGHARRPARRRRRRRAATATWSSARCTTARSLDALDVIPAVDAEYGAAIGRSWGGLTWEYLLDDAEVVLVAAGSLGTQLTRGRRGAARRGRQGRRARHPRLPAVPGRGAARAPSPAAARARLRQGAVATATRAPSAATCGPRCTARPARPPSSARSAASAVATCRPSDLADAARRAVADLDAGVRDRADRLDQPAALRRRPMTKHHRPSRRASTCCPATAPAPAAASASGCAPSPRRSTARWS